MALGIGNISLMVCWAVQAEIAMKFYTDIHGPQRMNPSAFGDPLTFHSAPTASRRFHSKIYYID